MMRSLAFALVMSLALAAACGGARPQSAATEAERGAYASAVALIASDPRAAEQRFEDFLRSSPRSPLADDAAERLVEIAIRAGDDPRAIRWLDYIVQNHRDADRAEVARLDLAQLESDRGNRTQSRRLLARLRLKRLPPDRVEDAHRLLLEMASEPPERMRWIAELRRGASSEADATRMDAEIEALLNAMSSEDLSRAALRLGSRIPAARVQLRLAERALIDGDFERAATYLRRASQHELADRDVSDLARLEDRVERREQIPGSGGLLPTFEQVASQPPPSTEGARGTIGVVLPLTGSLAAYGEESLRGVLLAARIFERSGIRDVAETDGVAPNGRDRREFSGGVRLIVRDSGGNPDRARAAVRELADRRDVVAVVGPLLAKSAEAAAQVAEEEGLPLLTLSSREEVARDRENVFRLRTTPNDQVSFLVDWAAGEGAQRFAILYPQDAYGRGMRDRFWRAVDERGGAVVGVGSYDPGATDFAEPIRRLIGYELLTRAERAALEQRSELLRRARRLDASDAALAREVAYSLMGPEKEPLPPIVDFDALFIPDSHEKIVLIAPQLAFHEVKGARLLGTDGWVHPDLLRIARGHVSGAVMASLFHAESRFEFVARFVEDYRASFGTPPDVFAAHAFDAATLVLVQLADGRIDREDVRDGVLRARGFPGVSGVTTVLADGNARKRPFLLRVRRGRIEPLD